MTNAGRAYFDAGQLTIEKVFSDGLALRGSYTLSKALGLATDFSNTGAGRDERRAQIEELFFEDLKAFSRFDAPHAFVLGYSYRLPRCLGAFTLSGTTILKDGTPLSIETGTDAPPFGNVDGERNDQLCSDGLDNDGDGKIDCQDEACANTAACLPGAEDCVNGQDDDGDSDIDCDDSDCTTDPECIAEICDEEDLRPDVLACPEARGFIFGSALAYRLGVGFVPIRKPNKLPYRTSRVEYDLEYGSNALEMHEDALSSGQSVILIDDLLATGGTTAACAELCEAAGARVLGALFLIELVGLGARDAIAPIQAHALLEYPA